MSLEISIAWRDVYTTDGQLDTTFYEIHTEEDEEYAQEIHFDSPAALVTLRDALSAYIDSNNLLKEY